MGRGERWRAMSGKVMGAVYCITICSFQSLFYRPIPVGAVGYHVAFLSCLFQICRRIHPLRASLIFFNF